MRQGVEDLPDRIDLSMVTEIAIGSGSTPPNMTSDHLPSGLPNSPAVASPLSFSLLSAHEGSLADQVAQDHSRWADWTDGLNILRRDGGHVASPETAGFVQTLTEIGLKIKLLGGFCFILRVTGAALTDCYFGGDRFVGGQGRDTQWVIVRATTYEHRLLLLGLV